MDFIDFFLTIIILIEWTEKKWSTISFIYCSSFFLIIEHFLNVFVVIKYKRSMISALKIIIIIYIFVYHSHSNKNGTPFK